MKSSPSSKSNTSGWRLATLIFVLAVVFGLYFSVSLYPMYFSPDVRQERAWMAKERADAQSRRQDTYGSTTPQGTFDLFVAALERGDTDLAAKYFVYDRQEQMKNRIIAGRGNILKVLSSTEKTGIENGQGSYTFYFSDKSKNPPYALTFVLDDLSGLWKLESL